VGLKSFKPGDLVTVSPFVSRVGPHVGIGIVVEITREFLSQYKGSQGEKFIYYNVLFGERIIEMNDCELMPI